MKLLFLALLFLIPLTGIAYADTFSFTTGSEYVARTSSNADTSCTTNGGFDIITIDDRTVHLRSSISGAGDSCYASAWEWDLSSIANTNLDVTDTRIRFDVDSVTSPRNCDYNSIAVQPSTLPSNSTNALILFNDIDDGTNFVSSDTLCTSVSSNVILDLGSSADTEIENALNSGLDWWAVGINYNSMVRDSGTHTIDLDDVELEITFDFIAPPAISDLACAFDTDTRPNYNVDCDWSKPSQGVLGYNIQRDGGSGFAVLVNNTGTPNTLFYNDTSLAQNTWQRYNLTSWNIAGQSIGSNIQNVTTTEGVGGLMNITASVVGDVFLANFTGMDTLFGFPTPTTSSYSLYNNTSTLLGTNASGIFWGPISSSSPLNMNATWSNFVNSTLLTSDVETVNKIHDPGFFTSIQGGHQVNYTLSRDMTQTDLNLKVNRIPINFKIECLYQDPIQAVTANMSNGIWSNKTDVGFLDDHIGVAASDNIYITCYNDELLFTTTSYTNSSQTLLGIDIYDNIYGEFLGVPVGIFFLILVAGYANQRTAPTWTVIILAMAGVLATIGFFSLDVAVWGLMLIAGMLGLMVGRKVF